MKWLIFILSRFSVIESRWVTDQLMGYPKSDTDDVTLGRGKHFKQNKGDKNRLNRLTENEGFELRRGTGNEEAEGLDIEPMKSHGIKPKPAVTDGEYENIENIAMKNEGFQRKDGENGPMGIQRWERRYALPDNDTEVDGGKAVGNKKFASKDLLEDEKFEAPEKRVVQNAGLKSKHALGQKEPEKVEKKEAQTQSLKTTIENEASMYMQNRLPDNNVLEPETEIIDEISDSLWRQLIKSEDLRHEKVTEEGNSKRTENKQLENKELELRGVMKDGKSGGIDNGLPEIKRLAGKRGTGNGMSKNMENRLIRNNALKQKTVIRDGTSTNTENGLINIEGLGPKKATEDGYLKKNIENRLTNVEMLGPKKDTEDGALKKTMDNGLTNIEWLGTKTDTEDGDLKKTMGKRLTSIDVLGRKKAKQDGYLKNKQLDNKAQDYRRVIKDDESDTMKKEQIKSEGLEPESWAEEENSDKLQNGVTEIEGLKQERLLGNGESNAVDALQRLEKRGSDPDSWCCLEYLIFGPEHHDAHWKSQEDKERFLARFENAEDRAQREGYPTIRKTYRSQTRGGRKQKKGLWKTFTTWCRGS